MATDPICGMTVEPGRAAGKYEHNGQVYYFCSRHCVNKFAADPERFVPPVVKDDPATDRVCGMKVNPKSAAAKQDYDGQTYYFCSQHCLTKFNQDPARFAAATAQAAVESKSATDPVCGMKVDPEHAAGKHEHNGQTYYFCSQHCLTKFKEDPDNFLSQQESHHRGHVHGASPDARGRGKAHPAHTAKTVQPGDAVYVCPMDPEVRASKPGACPRCGMALESETIAAPASRTGHGGP